MTHENHRVIATFKHGRVWNKRMYLFLSIAFYSISLLLIPFFIWTALTADILINGKVFMFILGPMLAICFALVPFFVGRNRQWAKKCLKDAVERKVTARLFDDDIFSGKNYKGAKLFVAFRYNSRKIRKHSCWDIYFKRFVDKEITILYSPTYNEILICE